MELNEGNRLFRGSETVNRPDREAHNQGRSSGLIAAAKYRGSIDEEQPRAQFPVHLRSAVKGNQMQ